MAKPILKWAGGKSDQLEILEEIIKPLLTVNNTYYEPFVGGGALVFDLEPVNAVINDINSELINLYSVVKANPEELIKLLKVASGKHCKDFYYDMRNLDRQPKFLLMSPVQKAARTVYLNKTCFNGLYRVNSKGYFNCPLGRTTTGKMPDIVQEDKIKELSKVLQCVQISNGDYHEVLKTAKPGDVIYLDPPYDYEDKHNFVGYNANGFSTADLEALAAECNRLIDLGCSVIVSNNDTTDVRRVFEGWTFKEVLARRSITPKSTGRTGAKEAIIYKLNK